MGITEQVDGLRNAVCRNKGMHHFGLPQPALHFLRMGKLHPYTIHTVGRMAPIKHIIAILHGQTSQIDGVCLYLQICIPGIVMLKKIGQRITRLLRQMFIFKIRTGIMAGN